MANVFAALRNSATQQKSLSMVDSRGGWASMIREPFTGAWQRNKEISQHALREFFAIYSCITLIAGDVAKLRWVLQRQTSDDIWVETTSPDYSKILKKPNRYQNHIQFKQWWMTSKLAQGNTYALKERNSSGVVIALYILDPCRVTPLVADDGSVYYQLDQDNLNDIESAIIVPASEIIHDRYQPQFHPLVGITPIFAAALSGKLGLRIQEQSQRFFENGSKPGGILTVPGAISDETAARIKAQWEANYTGENSGKTGVLGDGVKYEPQHVTSVDAQLVEQLKIAAEVVCSCFHVPPFKIGFGTLPSGSVEGTNLIYYTDCLQVLIEEMEICLNEGLALPDRYGIELDVQGLLRMDTQTLYKTLGEGIGAGLLAPNEGRRRINQPPKPGGESVYMQQQNYSLEALAKRDASEDPFSTSSAAPIAPEQEQEQDPVPAETEPTDEQVEDGAKMLALIFQKELTSAEHS